MSSVVAAQAALLLPPPKIRIQSASPEASIEVKIVQASPTSAPRRTRSLPVSGSPRDSDEAQKAVKRSATTAGLTNTKKDSDMSSPGSRDGSEELRKDPLSPPSKKVKPNSKDIDWADVTDPEERRRIQNRIAQRKFREKARENKERAERESRNQEHAGNSYRIPVGNDIGTEPELSGLPWGGVNLGLFVSRGLEAESRRSSGNGTYVGEEGLPTGPYNNAYGQGFAQAPSYGSSGGGDEAFYDEAPPFMYDASAIIQTFPTAIR